jgi:hypothetical protein
MKSVFGFYHLKNEDADVYFDGFLAADDPDDDVEYTKKESQVVSSDGGIIAPDAFYGDITVGLKYQTAIKTLPLSFEVAAASRGMQKNISKVYIRAGGEGTVSVSPAENNKPVPMQLTPTPQDSIPPMKEVPIMGDWDDDACLTIRHDYSGGFTLQSMVIEVASGG